MHHASHDLAHQRPVVVPADDHPHGDVAALIDLDVDLGNVCVTRGHVEPTWRGEAELAQLERSGLVTR